MYSLTFRECSCYKKLFRTRNELQYVERIFVLFSLYTVPLKPKLLAMAVITKHGN